MTNFLNFLKLLWANVGSNPIFVVASSAFVGSVVSTLQDELAMGHIDWTRGGLNKLTGYAITAAVAAIVHLYRPKPGIPQMLVTTPPSSEVHEAPAKIQPVSPADVAAK
jgi:hypothetical protein